jgi:O-antigen/teichoic acid export membrane protein
VLVVAVSCWLSLSSGFLVHAIAGEEYAAAASVLAVMAFYPVAQTLGQLTATSLKAMELTSVFARWTVLLSVPDLLLTYILLAPSDAPLPGFGLGAVGLAIKTALYGLISVHVFDWLSCRFLAVDYATLFRRRMVAALGVSGIAVVTMGLGCHWLRSAGVADVTSFVLASALYALMLGTILWRYPEVAGVSREQLKRLLRLTGEAVDAGFSWIAWVRRNRT